MKKEKEPCEDCGGKYCMCEACQSLKKMIQDMEKRGSDDLIPECLGGTEEEQKRKKE